MTVKEFTSRSIYYQIIFWDFLIRIMSAMQLVRDRIYLAMYENNSRENPLKTIFIALFWMAVGLYLGTLMGYLGI